MGQNPARLVGTAVTPAPDVFACQKAIVRAWADATAAWVAAHPPGPPVDAKALRTHARKLDDSGTMLAFGYVVGSARRGADFIMQSTIVNALVDGEDDEAEKRRLRQDMKRRTDALAVFGLIRRVNLTPVAVQLSLTPEGRAFHRAFDTAFACHLARLAAAETGE